jgi:hypothetical protein
MEQYNRCPFSSEGSRALGDLDIYGRIVLKWILTNWSVRTNKSGLNKVQWRAFVNKAMNVRVP